jgi:hypothetical protein
VTRPRGFAPWRPHQKTCALLADVKSVLGEYVDHLPLTIRQVFYRLVGAFGYEKSERAYERLTEALARARRAEVIDFAAIRDDGLVEIAPLGFSGTSDFFGVVLNMAGNYRRDRLAGQDVVVELWVEAAGMAPQLARVVHEYGIAVYSSGGFDSLTVKYEAARRIADRERRSVVLHVGDFDPSGVALFEAVEADVGAFVYGLDGLAPTFLRAAVTPEQIERLRLPTAPPKPTDKRSAWREGDQTVQAEAIPPDRLEAEVRQAVERWINLDVLGAVRKEEEWERRDLIDRLHRLGIGSEE